MLEFIQGVAEEVLQDDGCEVAFEVKGNQIITTVRCNGKDAQNTHRLARASSRAQGNTVGSALLAAL